jgi:hypothetical protein
LHGGIALNALGQVHITVTVSDNFVNGFMVSDTGALVMSTAAIAYFLEGLPRTATGALKGQTDTVPAATDPFLGGLRIGPLGGVYTTLTAPPVGDPPVNTVRPDVTGDAKVGATLTCSDGTWTGAAPITYTSAWFQGINPTGITTTTYVVQAGDVGEVISCIVTATNIAGGANARSLGVRITFARYDYKTVSSVPATGNINSTGLQVRVNDVDKDGQNHAGPLSRLNVGDSIFVGTQEGIITAEAIQTSGYTILEVASWPLLADGEYFVTLGFN